MLQIRHFHLDSPFPLSLGVLILVNYTIPYPVSQVNKVKVFFLAYPFSSSLISTQLWTSIDSTV